MAAARAKRRFEDATPARQARAKREADEREAAEAEEYAREVAAAEKEDIDALREEIVWVVEVEPEEEESPRKRWRRGE